MEIHGSHHQWIVERLDPFYVKRLDLLPRVIDTTIMGHSVLFTHYHIEQGKLSAPSVDAPFSSIVQSTLDNMNNLFRDCHQELICFGYHHSTHFFKPERVTYLNPGSLGCAQGPYARYAIVTLTSEHFDVSLHKAAYDNHDFLRSYVRLDVPDRELLIKAFHRNQSLLNGTGVSSKSLITFDS
ncbi:metallophosphoesterase family protein [Sporolactobacillus shoreicorticis]|uniref:Metallophosphoesterase family protein n=1 Tax=Sporolactobacillus shoreicorticis TaxID=1923877 RepID=A0ABW5S256_9BACL|nr:metallophosphoesterase family protein [Sporolactobacillus shoreicorticis]MCO7125885.1 metallophosphoesterase family protein [Sporolactobacillus shoreicorticis]